MEGSDVGAFSGSCKVEPTLVNKGYIVVQALKRRNNFLVSLRVLAVVCSVYRHRRRRRRAELGVLGAASI